MKEWYREFGLTATLIAVLLSALSLGFGCGPARSVTSFQYLVRVRVKDAEERIENAKVTIEVRGETPLEVNTDSNGLASFLVPSSHAGQPSKLIVEATGYRQHSQYIDLVVDALPSVVELERESSESAPPTSTPTLLPTETPVSAPASQPSPTDAPPTEAPSPSPPTLSPSPTPTPESLTLRRDWSSDPATGSVVAAGQSVTYRIEYHIEGEDPCDKFTLIVGLSVDVEAWQGVPALLTYSDPHIAQPEYNADNTTQLDAIRWTFERSTRGDSGDFEFSISGVGRVLPIDIIFGGCGSSHLLVPEALFL